MLLVGAFYTSAVCLSLWGLTISYVAPEDRTYSSICLLGWALDNHLLYIKLFHLFCSGCGVASVLLFIVVGTVARRASTKNTGKSTGTKGIADKLQRRMTTSICLSSLGNIFLFVLPTYLLSYLIAQGDMTYAPLILAFTNLNPIANFLIFTTRHKELQKGIMYLLKGKQLTQAALQETTNPGR